MSRLASVVWLLLPRRCRPAFVDDLLRNGVAYLYKVAAEDDNGVLSVLAEPVSVMPPWPQLVWLPMIVQQ